MPHRYAALSPVEQGFGKRSFILWERARPQRVRRAAWHRLRRCSRACPLPRCPAQSDIYVRV